MVLYRCPRCGFQNKIKTKMRNHYYRKKPCEPTLKDISIPECLDLLKGNSLKIPENIPEKYPKNPEKSLKTEISLKIAKNIPKIPENIPEKISQISQNSNLKTESEILINNLRKKPPRPRKRYTFHSLVKLLQEKTILEFIFNNTVKLQMRDEDEMNLMT